MSVLLVTDISMLRGLIGGIGAELTVPPTAEVSVAHPESVAGGEGNHPGLVSAGMW